MYGRARNEAVRLLVRYYAALRIAAGSMLDITPIGVVADVPPLVRPSANALPSGFDRRELIQVDGRTHVVTVASIADQRRHEVGLN